MALTVARCCGARAVLALSAMTIAACSSGTETPVPVVSIEMNATTVSMSVGQAVQLTAVPKSAAGDRLTARTVLWATQAPTVATVSLTGLVSGVGAGTTTITATSGSVTATIQVTVISQPHVALSSSAVSLTGIVGGGAGGLTQQTVNITNSGGGTFTGLTVGTIQYGAGQPTGWLSASLGGSTPPTTLTVSAAVGNLATGTYTASFNLVASGAENSPVTVTVSFVVSNGVKLSVVGTGAGNGSVSGSGINCTLAGGSTNGTCAVFEPTGSSVTLTADAQGSHVFNGWNGPCAGIGNCVITMTGDMTVGATFSPHGFNLTITGGGTGSGTVVGSGGINCAIAAGVATGVCQVTLIPNSTAQLTETSTGGSSFTSWGGGCSGTAPTCTLSMSAVSTVTASFAAGPPSIILSPSSLQFTAIRGASNPPSQTVSISNGSFGPLTGLTTGTIQYSGNKPPWLTPTLNTAATPPTLTLQPTVGTLGVGTYTASVPIVVPTATNSPQNLSVTFTINPAPLSVTTIAATSISQTNATLNGIVTQDGNPYTAFFDYGTDSTVSQRTGTLNGPPTGCGSSQTCTISMNVPVTHGTTYYFRFDVTNAGGTSKGAILSFTP